MLGFLPTGFPKTPVEAKLDAQFRNPWAPKQYVAGKLTQHRKGEGMEGYLHTTHTYIRTYKTNEIVVQARPIETYARGEEFRGL